MYGKLLNIQRKICIAHAGILPAAPNLGVHLVLDMAPTAENLLG